MALPMREVEADALDITTTARYVAQGFHDFAQGTEVGRTFEAGGAAASVGAEQMAWRNEQVGRAAEPDDEARATVWLPVGESEWVNGVNLPVDGGLSAGMRVGWADTKSSPASPARRQQG